MERGSTFKKRTASIVASQKVIFGFLGVVSLTTLVLGVVQVSRAIKYPSRVYETLYQSPSANNSSASFQQDQALRLNDTDRDGLNDYDELYVYKTSPYLADSDADGFSDQEEISTNHDPNCPTGQNCYREQIVSEEERPIESTNGLERNDGILFDASLDITSLSVDQIRILLLQSGQVTQEELSQVDDAALLQIYQEVLNETSPVQ